jgi:hypothetical protein|tara:strand:+ start:354 stop:539 length:186 start_codon:yes stop_codon:yes gene_type:complete
MRTGDVEILNQSARECHLPRLGCDLDTSGGQIRERGLQIGFLNIISSKEHWPLIPFVNWAF